jgi:hypothetical protein
MQKKMNLNAIPHSKKLETNYVFSTPFCLILMFNVNKVILFDNSRKVETKTVS